MIRHLRRRHRTAALGLAIIAPIVLLTALADRKPVVVDNTPLLGQPGAAADALPRSAQRAITVGDAQVTVDLYASADARFVTLSKAPAHALAGPDVLLYAQAAPGAALAADAVLLGPMPTRPTTRVDLPRDASTLVFYSLAHQRVVARMPLDADP